jgi:hypothetical protein
LPVVLLGLAMVPGECARAQFGFSGGISGYPAAASLGSAGYGAGIGSVSSPLPGYPGGSLNFGSNPFGGAGYGYSIGTGRVGSGYLSSNRLFQRSFQAARPQTTIALQPLYDAITAVPGWSGRTHRARRRLAAQPSVPRTSSFDASGKVIWPSTIPNDPADVALRQSADAAVQAVVREWKSTGHGSVRPVVDAKNKLSAFEHKVLPEVKTKNTTDGAELETFFFDLDKSLDAMTYTY